MTSIHERIGELIELAKTYAEDGAFRTAAARLREAADMLDTHANATDATTEARFFDTYMNGEERSFRAEIERMAQPGKAEAITRQRFVRESEPDCITCDDDPQRCRCEDC